MSFFVKNAATSSALCGNPAFLKKFSIEIKGQKIRSGAINWFQSILVRDTEMGIAIDFMFSENMEPFLLELNQYVKLKIYDIVRMNGQHTIHLYSVFKAERGRTKKGTESVLVYGLTELKSLLGIYGKYKIIGNFKARVLDPAMSSINESNVDMSVSYRLLKTRRKVTGVEFTITDKASPKKALKIKDREPTPEEIDQLPHAKRKAYHKLIEFGVTSGIAFYTIIPTIKGETVQGYEDYFIELAIEHSKVKSTSKKKAGAFVTWWTKFKSYDSVKGKDWSAINEKIMERKKKLRRENPEAYNNREEAKNMTYTEFVERHRKENSTAGSE